MSPAALVTLNMRELDRLKVIQAVVDLGLKPGRAAERLGLSVRQIERLVLGYRAAGVAGLVSGKRGRPSNHQLPAGKAQRALTLIRERKEKNRLVAEYALRGVAKPMGVAEYQLMRKVPPSLETGLPTIDQIEAELRPDLPDGTV